MGNLSEPQASAPNNNSKKEQFGPISKDWEVLQRTLQREILKSKKTSLIVERYWFEMQHHQDFDTQHKLFQWRNHNPNSEFIVNVLSVRKDQSANQQQSTFQCGSNEWCPSQKIKSKVYVVTERILKLREICDVLNFQKQMDQATSNNHTKILYATEQSYKLQSSSKNIQKILPFIGVNFSQTLARQLLKDWIRSIEVLCYKFGYFYISNQHLGMTAHKKGTCWISNNYASNHLSPQKIIKVTTAEQKFKFERQTISKILTLSQGIPCFTNTIYALKEKKIERFDQFCNFLDQIGKSKRQSRKIVSHQPSSQNLHNNSMFVQQGSFVAQGNNPAQINSSFFLFDYKISPESVYLTDRMNLNEEIIQHQTLANKITKKIDKNQKNRHNFLIRNEGKRSNTGEKVMINLSPQCQQQQISFVSSNHKHCGRETAPTNELVHSSSLQSDNHGPQMKYKFEEIEDKKYEQKHMVKSQYDTKIHLKNQSESELQKGISPNKIYFHHNSKNSLSGDPLIFRSHAANNLSSPKSPKYHNLSFNSPDYHKFSNVQRNYSLDQNNITGPYRKDRVFSNLKKQKIALVDSMVMVRQQSQQVEDDIQNASRGKYLLEESIIIMGRQNDEILSDAYLT